MKKISYLFALLLIITSCSKEEVEVDNSAFSTDACTEMPADLPVGGDETFYKFNLDNGKPVWSNSGDYTLAIVADEKVRQVYIWAEGKGWCDWQRVDSSPTADFGKGSFDVDGYLRNGSCRLFNSDKEGLSAFAVGPEVYVAFGGKYTAIRVDEGEVFRAGFGGCGEALPGGVDAIFYHDFNRANFPANFLGVKNGELYNFGSSLTDTSDDGVIEVRGYGMTPTIEGPFKYTFVRTNKKITLTVNGQRRAIEKERRNGVNFYKR